MCQILCAEEGLESAVRCSDALYSGTADQLARLSATELECMFTNTTACELFLDSETTLFDVVMKANCFRYESNLIVCASDHCCVCCLLVIDLHQSISQSNYLIFNVA